jgi:hypothetical protein
VDFNKPFCARQRAAKVSTAALCPTERKDQVFQFVLMSVCPLRMLAGMSR